MKNTFKKGLFFAGWFLLALTALLINYLNVKWSLTPTWQGVSILIVLTVIQGSVLELVVLAVTTMIYGKRQKVDKRAPCSHLSLILNYNLLAMSREDIEGTYKRMYLAYMNNLQPNVAAVLVSATNEQALKEYELHVRDNYRILIRDTLLREGHAFSVRHFGEILPLRLENIWKMYIHLDRRSFLQDHLPGIVDSYVRDFMCIQRVSRVLRKCGQYQDLILLSEGDDTAFTYTDKTFYSSMARPFNEHLFYESLDVQNIFDRQFDYTLVLDGDTKVPAGAALSLLGIAAAHKKAAIIQPAIIMDVDERMDTMFMYLEKLRQEINQPITEAVSDVLGHSGFFGKGLIKNKSYVEHVIGTRENPIERVPIDVLSHDTFEAAVLETYYAGSVGLLEAPCFNYVSWNIRERRWNKGEVLLAMYFWKTFMGQPMRALQRFVQGKGYVKTRLRTESEFNFISSYIAQSAFRQMFMKPLLLIFILLHINVHLKFSYYPIIAMMFLIIIFPKFATCTRKNYKCVVIECISSVLQFTPEAVVGTVRIMKAFKGNICKFCKWTPQMAAEEEFRKSNPFLSSVKHLWGYSLLSVVVGVLVAVFCPQGMLAYIMLSVLFLLPLYTGLTSFTLKMKTPRSQFRIYGVDRADALGTVSWTDFSGIGCAQQGNFNVRFPTDTSSAIAEDYRSRFFRNNRDLRKHRHHLKSSSGAEPLVIELSVTALDEHEVHHIQPMEGL